MSTDRELLELAAKAAGIEWIPASTQKGTELEPVFGLWLKLYCEPYEGQRRRWNPLTDDGDALRLAVNLGLAVIPYPFYAKPKHSVIAKQYSQARYLRGESEDVRIEEIQIYRDDPAAATRRAIVRAAAEIGRTTPAAPPAGSRSG